MHRSVTQRRRRRRRTWRVEALGAAAAVLLAAFAAGCGSEPERKPAAVIKPRYETLPPKKVPDFMKGTVLEVADVQNKQPYPISGYGLVVNLAGTGNNTGAPLSVRGAMVEEMVRRGLGSQNDALRPYKPEDVLKDPRVAIVEVFALLPPGARAGQRIDVFVQACTGSNTTSLARGLLWQCNLYVNGVDPLNPRPKVNVFGTASGPLFVNPGYVTAATHKPVGDEQLGLGYGGSRGGPATRPGGGSAGNLRTAVIMGGGTVAADRPIGLRVRTPQLSLTRTIEMRVDQYFQDEAVARTQDEGLVWMVMPEKFKGDWEHFVGIVTHLYLDGTPGTGLVRARRLAEEAVKPDAPLLDISYAWEGLGPEALPAIQLLYGHPRPDVAFAAARAGVYIGDRSADETMLAIAKAHGHPFQLNAVKVLGSLPTTTRVERMLVELLGAKNALVRVEAYRVLAEADSPAILSRPILRGQFAIDRVACEGTPLIFATRTREPRLAILGPRPSFKLPMVFNAMDWKLTIASRQPTHDQITVFDGTNEAVRGGVTATMRPDIYEMLLRLAGEGEDGFRFGYSDLVGIVQGLTEAKLLDATFVLQDSPQLQQAIEDAPPLPEGPVPAPAAPEAPRAALGSR